MDVGLRHIDKQYGHTYDHKIAHCNTGLREYGTVGLGNLQRESI